MRALEAINGTSKCYRAVSPTFAMVLVLLFSCNSSAQTVKSLHTFTGGTDGGGPEASVVADPKGNLFGTTWYGGTGNCTVGCGTIFREAAPSKPDGKWTFSTLYNFEGGVDGCCNSSTLALDNEGRLYGVTNGGLANGSVFRLTPAGGKSKFEILYTFLPTVGWFPWTPLLLDKAGAIYAASLYNGLAGCLYNDACGTVVQLVPPKTEGGAWTAKMLHRFRGKADGGNPSSPLVADANGMLYGATYIGGRGTESCAGGCGVVFSLTPPAAAGGAWTEKVLYSFQGGANGSGPWGLTMGTSGDLFGLACCQGTESLPFVFRLTPPAEAHRAWHKTVIAAFTDPYGYPPSYITFGGDGVLYGTVFGDIDLDAGIAFQLTAPKFGQTWKLKTLWDFNNGPTLNPNGVILGKFGALYGTLGGGDSDAGAVFELER